MKIQCLLLNAVMFMAGVRLWGGPVQFDNHYFNVMNAALTVPHIENDFGFLKTNAEALCLLEKTTFNRDGLSNSVRLSVTLSALNATTHYTTAAHKTPENLTSFIASSNICMSLSLLDDSSKMLEQIPAPTAYLNVGGPGVPAAGMEPSGIKDPKVREEYERRIAENRNNLDVSNLRYQVEQGIDYLKRSIKSVIINAHLQKKGEPFKESIMNSPLSEPIKEEFLKTSRQQ